MVSAKAASMASEGLRVLALAYGSQKNALTLAGLVGMSDPPRYQQHIHIKYRVSRGDRNNIQRIERRGDTGGGKAAQLRVWKGRCADEVQTWPGRVKAVIVALCG